MIEGPTPSPVARMCLFTELGDLKKKEKLTPEQYGFEMYGSAYTWIFFNKHSGKFLEIWIFEKTHS